MNNELETVRQHEQGRKDWFHEVNKRSPWWKFCSDDYEDFLEMEVSIAEWLANELQDESFMHEPYPYGEQDVEGSGE